MKIYNASQVGVQNQQEIIALSIKKSAGKVVTLILVEATAEAVAAVIKKKQAMSKE